MLARLGELGTIPVGETVYVFLVLAGSSYEYTHSLSFAFQPWLVVRACGAMIYQALFGGAFPWLLYNVLFTALRPAN